jgi:hypothetical protein
MPAAQIHPIEGFPNYGLTRAGIIYRTDRPNPRPLKPRIHKGFPIVNLYRDGIAHRCLVHRLVAETLVPNPGYLKVTKFKNGNREDTRKANLSWVASVQKSAKTRKPLENKAKTA